MVNIKKCNQCGYLWTARSLEEPKQCPRCKRYDYAYKFHKVDAQINKEEVKQNDN